MLPKSKRRLAQPLALMGASRSAKVTTAAPRLNPCTPTFVGGGGTPSSWSQWREDAPDGVVMFLDFFDPELYG